MCSFHLTGVPSTLLTVEALLTRTAITPHGCPVFMPQGQGSDPESQEKVLVLSEVLRSCWAATWQKWQLGTKPTGAEPAGRREGSAAERGSTLKTWLQPLPHLY